MTIFAGLLAGEDYVRNGTPLVPALPTDLAVDSVTTTTATLVWVDNANNETGFRVEYKLATDSEWTFFGNTAADAETATVTGLTDGTTYDFRIRAFSSSAYSAWVEAEGTTAYEFANGIRTDGVNDSWIKSGLATPASPLTDFSVSFWVRFPGGFPAGGGSGQRCWELYNSSTVRGLLMGVDIPIGQTYARWALQITGGIFSFSSIVNNFQDPNADPDYKYHVCAVFDSSNLTAKIYADGILVWTATMSTGASLSPNYISGVALAFGAKVGLYDNLAFIRKALTETEVLQIWNNGNGSRFIDNLPTSEKFAYYKFNGTTSATTAAVDEIHEGGVNRDLTLANGANYQPFNP